MKLFNVYIISILLLAGLIQSCSKMTDLQDKYMDEGETIYAAKVDSVFAYAGKERILLKMFIGTQRVEKVRIFWNDYKDSVDVSVGGQTGKFEKQLEKMAEKGYVFHFVNFDKFGNRSLPFELSAQAYGEYFQSNIVGRMVKDNMTCMTNGVLTINWLSPVDKSLGCELKYINSEGEAIREIISNDVTSTIINDYASDLQYRTLFLPEPSAIDTFYTNYTPIKVVVEEKLSHEGWTITGFDTEEPAEGAPNGLASAAIDGNLGTFWHSQWAGANPGYPHWFSVDLGKEVTISSFEVYRRQGDGRGQTRHQFLYSTNGTDWNLFGTFSMDPYIDEGQKYSSAELPKARYIKYVALEGQGFFAFLSELDVYIAK